MILLLVIFVLMCVDSIASTLLFSETFANYFGKFGEVVDSVIMTDRITGNPRGFGFVTFADSAVAEKVLEEDHVIDDRKVDMID